MKAPDLWKLPYTMYYAIYSTTYTIFYIRAPDSWKLPFGVNSSSQLKRPVGPQSAPVLSGWRLDAADATLHMEASKNQGPEYRPQILGLL